jgi:hypothetical protein
MTADLAGDLLVLLLGVLRDALDADLVQRWLDQHPTVSDRDVLRVLVDAVVCELLAGAHESTRHPMSHPMSHQSPHERGALPCPPSRYAVH